MLKEYGMDPNIPGLEVTETLIEEDLRYNPNCPCKTRTCPQHGFCKYCVQHHAELAELLKNIPHPPEPESRGGTYPNDHGRPVCYRIPSERNAAGRDDYN